MPDIRDHFRQAYARMCATACTTHLSGAPLGTVVYAMTTDRPDFTGKGHAAGLMNVTQLRTEAHALLRRGVDMGIPFQLLIEDARRAKEAIESEFGVELPLEKRV